METPYEHILLNAYKEEMISYLYDHPEYFNEAVELAISDKQPYAWRSAWLLWSCMQENDERVRAYIERIIETIPFKKDGHQRELVKILGFMELDEEQEGHFFNICVTIWEKIGKRPSVRWIAFKHIVQIAEKHPELRNEISLYGQDHYLESLSPGIKRVVAKMVYELRD